MRRVLLSALGVLVLLGIGYGGYVVLSDPRRAEPVEATRVTLTDNRFDNPVISVPVGSAINWTFAGEETHNVVGDGWRSPDMLEGQWTHTFTAPGTYDYVCALHPLSMRGRVVVSG